MKPKEAPGALRRNQRSVDTSSAAACDVGRIRVAGKRGLVRRLRFPRVSSVGAVPAATGAEEATSEI